MSVKERPRLLSLRDAQTRLAARGRQQEREATAFLQAQKDRVTREGEETRETLEAIGAFDLLGDMREVWRGASESRISLAWGYTQDPKGIAKEQDTTGVNGGAWAELAIVWPEELLRNLVGPNARLTGHPLISGDFENMQYFFLSPQGRSLGKIDRDRLCELHYKRDLDRRSSIRGGQINYRTILVELVSGRLLVTYAGFEEPHWYGYPKFPPWHLTIDSEQISEANQNLAVYLAKQALLMQDKGVSYGVQKERAEKELCLEGRSRIVMYTSHNDSLQTEGWPFILARNTIELKPGVYVGRGKFELMGVRVWTCAGIDKKLLQNLRNHPPFPVKGIIE